MRKKPSILQQWQRDRFQLKGGVAGTITRLRQLRSLDYTTAAERTFILSAIHSLENVKKIWNQSQAGTRRFAENEQKPTKKGNKPLP